MIGVILAAGMAKRLRPLTDERPKCLLKVEKLAIIDGDVKCGAAILAGSIKGDVDCKRKLVLQDNAKIIGNVKAEQLIINEGAIFQGSCEMSTTTIK